MPTLADTQQKDTRTQMFFFTLTCTSNAHLTEPSQIFLSVPGLGLFPQTGGQRVCGTATRMEG